VSDKSKSAAAIDPEPGEVWFLPLLHPSAIVRGQWNKEPAQVLYLKRLSDSPPLDISESLGNIFPSLSQMEEFHQEALEWTSKMRGNF
jgi:hypothetical protein